MVTSGLFGNLKRVALAAFAFYRSPSFPTFIFSSYPSSSPSSLILPSFLLPRVPQAGSRRPASTPPRERGDGHHARDRAGSWGLPPQRPTLALLSCLCAFHKGDLLHHPLHVAVTYSSGLLFAPVCLLSYTLRTHACPGITYTFVSH